MPEMAAVVVGGPYREALGVGEAESATEVYRYEVRVITVTASEDHQRCQWRGSETGRPHPKSGPEGLG